MSESNDFTPLLLVERLTKRFCQGDIVIEALRGVSLTVWQGEFVAVMGASGSGKSTLLHLVAGLTRPDEGRVLVDGHDLAAMSDRQLTQFRRRRIGLVFQAFNLIPALTAEENIRLPILSGRRVESADERVERLVARLGLADRRRHKPDALSGGEQQRVAIARALVTEPSIILADEPTGSLDSVSGKRFCRLLREQCVEQNRAIVVVTHEPTVAMWARRIVVLRDGRVLSEFETAEFRNAQGLAARYQELVAEAATSEEPV